MIARKTPRALLPAAAALCLCNALAAAQRQPPPIPELQPAQLNVQPSTDIKSARDTPAATPRIQCRSGQLTIAAENATLRSILTALQSCVIDPITLPDVSLDERSWIHLGPGPVREIMDELLSSTSLNYVLEPSDGNSSKIQSVLLLAQAPTPGGEHLRGAARLAERSSSPARDAWLASRNLGRGAAPDDVAEPQQSAEAPVSGFPVTRVPASTPVGSSAQSSGDNAAEDVKADAGQHNTLANELNPPAAGAPSVPAAQPASATDKELQNKIVDMQQLFEQRKKMSSTGAPSD